MCRLKSAFARATIMDWSDPVYLSFKRIDTLMLRKKFCAKPNTTGSMELDVNSRYQQPIPQKTLLFWISHPSLGRRGKVTVGLAQKMRWIILIEI